MNAYVQSGAYGRSNRPMLGAAVFKNYANGLYSDYVLRFNGTNDVPDTNNDNVELLRTEKSRTLGYYNPTFFALQTVIDMLTLNTTGVIKYDTAAQYPISRLAESFNFTANIMPLPAYRKDRFSTALGENLGLMLIIIFIWTLSCIVTSFTEEKELRIREGMKMMGLKHWVLILSWILTYLIMFFFTAISIALATSGSVYEYSSTGIIFIFYFLFLTSLFSFGYFISAFFDRARLASTAASILMLLTYFISLTVQSDSTPETRKQAACLVPSICLTLGAKIISTLESTAQGATNANIDVVIGNFTVQSAIVMLFVDTILYFILAVYLEQVLPSDYGIRQPWYFPILPSYWGCNCCSSSKKNKVASGATSTTATAGAPGGGTDNGFSVDAGAGRVVLNTKGANKAVDGNNIASLAGVNSHVEPVENFPQDPGANIEPVDPYLRGRELVSLRGLQMIFPGRDGVPFKAVRGLSLDMYEGQIFSLLGHNGAGKSTTMNMLTGLFPPTAGQATILGNTITEDMEEIRKNMGVCPQHDILYPTLTVYEHLDLFAKIKGVPSKDRHDVVMEMIERVGLGESGDRKKDSATMTLSGGQKRKLSVGIALIGGSRIVFLDEPSSGMDVSSQRHIWDMLMKSKAGRVIVLTTHSMEEAELGDRIAIMSHGSLRCNGSSLYLKSTYGVGYTLTISKASSSSSSSAAAAAAAALAASSANGTAVVEVNGASTSQASSSSSSSSSSSTGKVSTSAPIIAFMKQYAPFAQIVSDAGGEIAFRCPIVESSKFPALFDKLDEEKKALGITTYGVSVTTLTEVFLKVGDEGAQFLENGLGDAYEKHQLPHATDESSKNGTTVVGGTAVVDVDLSKVSEDEMKINKNSIQLDDIQPTTTSKTKDEIVIAGGDAATTEDDVDVSDTEYRRDTGCKLCLLHTRALYIKRWHAAKRDKRQWMWQIFIPSLLLFFSILLIKISAIGSFPSRSFSIPTLWSTTSLPYPYGNLAGNTVPDTLASYLSGTRGGVNLGISPVMWTHDAAGGTQVDFQKHLLATALNQTQNRYMAVCLSETTNLNLPNLPAPTGNTKIQGALYVNYTAYDALPTNWNAFVNSLLRAKAGPDAPAQDIPNVRTSSHPFELTASQKALVTSVTAFAIALSLSFIPGTFAAFIVKEREDKGKHLQSISGVSPVAYWLSSYFWDLTNFAIPFGLSIIFLVAFDVKDLIGEAIGATILLYWLFAISVTPFAYCFSFLFTTHTTAQHMLLLVNFVGSVILLIVSIVMDIIQSTQEINKVLKYIYRLFPPFCMGDAMVRLSARKSQVTQRGRLLGVWDMDIVGTSMLFMFIDFCIYTILLIILEHYTTTGGCSCLSKKLLGDVPDDPALAGPEDDDVAAERQRILNNQTNGDAIVLKGLRKVYGARSTAKPHVAIADLFYAVHKGECFGFLGANGAGKTTTMKVLTGDIYPTKGTASLDGFDVLSQPYEVRQRIGYCPQFDALQEFLTAREHLELYARIKCVPEDKLKAFVDRMLDKLSLTGIADKPAGTYSGGNKRKLSVGIALIGNPPIVFLDEPSTGMDPQARRFMWKLISTTMANRSVVLTTHSMEECEALCNRIGIMTNGRLQCLGTSQHLKTKFGKGYQLSVKSEVGGQDTVKSFISSRFPDASIIEEHGQNLRFRIPRDKYAPSISAVFRAFESDKQNSGVLAYSVSETDLEQLFIQFVKEGELRRKMYEDKLAKEEADAVAALAGAIDHNENTHQHLKKDLDDSKMSYDDASDKV